MAKSRGNICRTNVNNLDRSASYLLKISLLAVSTSVLLCIIQGGVSAAANFNSALQIKPKVYIHSYSEYQYFRGLNVKRRDFLSEQHRSRFTRTIIPGADKHHSANIYSTAQDVQETVQCQMNAVVNSGSQRHETNYNTIALKMSVNEENKLLDLYIGFSDDVLSSCTCFNRSLTDLKCHSKNAVNIGFSDKLLKSIQKLSATHNNLTAVLFISRDDGLLSLHINNKVNNINIRVLRLMEDLTELDLSRNELTELDITQSKLKFLTHINVSFNKLEKFNSKSFQIKELNMSRNYIKDISFVNFLTDLEQLDLSHNKIKYISNETFQGLSKLNQLYLDHNYIVDTIFLTHLNRKISSLHLSNNLIEHVLTYLNTEFISLTDVYLDCNAIADSDFSTIPLYLDILNLTNNKISKVTGLSKSNLIYLYLANNSLSNIKFISSMTNLRYIDLSNNNLQHIDYDIVINTSNPNIELNLESTNLSSVNFIARSLDKVAILNVNNNNISCFPLSKMRTGNLRLYIENNPVENLFCPSSQREKLSKCEVGLHSREWENYIEVFWTDPNTNNFLSCLKRKNVLDICHVDLCSGVKIQNISYHLLILSCIFLIIE